MVVATCSVVPTTAATKSIQLIVEGKTIVPDVKPEVKNRTTYVPLSFIGKALGATTKWESPYATLTLRDDSMRIQINSGNYILNNEEFYTDAVPYLKNGRVMVPLRLVGEALDCTVHYVVETGEIKISSNYVEVPEVPKGRDKKTMADVLPPLNMEQLYITAYSPDKSKVDSSSDDDNDDDSVYFDNGRYGYHTFKPEIATKFYNIFRRCPAILVYQEYDRTEFYKGLDSISLADTKEFEFLVKKVGIKVEMYKAVRDGQTKAYIMSRGYDGEYANIFEISLEQYDEIVKAVQDGLKTGDVVENNF